MRLSLRLGLIVGLTLTLVVSVLVVAFILVQRPARLYAVSLPLPRQVAAMAELIEQLPPDRWPVATDAMRTTTMDVAVLDASPVGKGGRAMPGLGFAQRAYALALDGRAVAMMAELERPTEGPDITMNEDGPKASRPLRILVSLRNGKILMIESRRPPVARFTGIRLGVMALMVSLLIGMAALWSIRAQLKPLERLSHAVDKFGTRLEASTLAEEGSIELRHLIAAFNRLQANIGDLVRARTRMITAVGHDIGTYLTRLRLRADFISDEDQRERAIRDIDDMHRLMRETLALARLEHDGEDRVAVDIVPVLWRLIEATAEAGAPIGAELAPGPVMVRIGVAALERAVGNLVENALKYGQEAHVALRTAKDTAEILVEDRGPGIPAEARQAVLEPFYRLDAARNLNQSGFGLGLAIVSGVVKAADGTLSLEDREGGGLSVHIRLPRV